MYTITNRNEYNLAIALREILAIVPISRLQDQLYAEIIDAIEQYIREQLKVERTDD